MISLQNRLWSLGTGFAYPFVFTIPYGDTIRILIAVTVSLHLNLLDGLVNQRRLEQMMTLGQC